MSIAVGDLAPEFTTRDQHHQEVSLADFRGRRSVLLVFYPFAFSRICTSELGAIRADLDSFQNEQVQVLPISIDHPFALKAYAEQQDYQFPLLADFWPHGEIARRYGVLNDKAGFAVRGTFLIDTDGIVQYAAINDPGSPRDQGEWKRAIATLG